TNSINDSLAIDTIDNVTGYLPTLGSGLALNSNWRGTNTGTYFEFSTLNLLDAFKMVSLRAEVWSNSYGMSEVYAIKGFANGVEAASATVDFSQDGRYGLGDSYIDYDRQTTPQEEAESGGGANAGLLTFGQAWDGIDTVRFEVADIPPFTILGVSIDELIFAPATTPIMAPGTPGAPDLAHNSDSGTSNSDNITNANTLS